MFTFVKVLLILFVVCSVLQIITEAWFWWLLIHDTPSRPAQQQNNTVQATNTERPKESVFDVQMRQFREEDARRAQEQAQWALDEHMRIAQEAQDTAMRMHQQAQDTAMQMHQEAYNTAVQMQQEASNWEMYYNCYGDDYGYPDLSCEEAAIQDTFTLANDMHNNAVNDAAFTAQSDFSMFSGGGFGF